MNKPSREDLRTICVFVDNVIKNVSTKRRNSPRDGMFDAETEFDLGSKSVTKAADRIWSLARKYKCELSTYIKAGCAIVYRRTDLPLTIVTIASSFVEKEAAKYLNKEKVVGMLTDIDAEDIPSATNEISCTDRNGYMSSIELILGIRDKVDPDTLGDIVIGMRGVVHPQIIFDFPTLRSAWRKGVISVPNISYAAAFQLCSTDLHPFNNTTNRWFAEVDEWEKKFGVTEAGQHGDE